MKIIVVDNFNSETKSDELIAEHVPEGWAVCIVQAMNAMYGGPRSSLFIKAVPDDYTLFVWEP